MPARTQLVNYGDDIMTNQYLTTIQARFAPVIRHILSIRQIGAATALTLALALGAGLSGISPPAQAQQAATASAVATVNINSADAETLAARLNGVGQSRAMEIVRYREAYGPFSKVEELAEVKGIGKSTLDKNRTVITLE
jgi:competence protein ComEA